MDSERAQVVTSKVDGTDIQSVIRCKQRASRPDSFNFSLSLFFSFLRVGDDDGPKRSLHDVHRKNALAVLVDSTIATRYCSSSSGGLRFNLSTLPRAININY